MYTLAPKQKKTPAAGQVLQRNSGEGRPMGFVEHRPGVVYQPKENKTGLPDRLKEGIESLSGMDMSDVRVHRNSPEPASLNALAYTRGRDIHVAPGQERHLPHEAWHVVQQKQGRVQPTMQMADANINDSERLEKEADIFGKKANQLSLNPPNPNPHPMTNQVSYTLQTKNVTQLKSEMGFEVETYIYGHIPEPGNVSDGLSVGNFVNNPREGDVSTDNVKLPEGPGKPSYAQLEFRLGPYDLDKDQDVPGKLQERANIITTAIANWLRQGRVKQTSQFDPNVLAPDKVTWNPDFRGGTGQVTLEERIALAKANETFKPPPNAFWHPIGKMAGTQTTLSFDASMQAVDQLLQASVEHSSNPIRKTAYDALRRIALETCNNDPFLAIAIVQMIIGALSEGAIPSKYAILILPKHKTANEPTEFQNIGKINPRKIQEKVQEHLGPHRTDKGDTMIDKLLNIPINDYIGAKEAIESLVQWTHKGEGKPGKVGYNDSTAIPVGPDRIAVEMRSPDNMVRRDLSSIANFPEALDELYKAGLWVTGTGKRLPGAATLNVMPPGGAAAVGLDDPKTKGASTNLKKPSKLKLRSKSKDAILSGGEERKAWNRLEEEKKAKMIEEMKKTGTTIFEVD